MTTVVNCAAYTDGRRIREITVEEISDFVAQDGVFVWLGLHEPDQHLMRKVQEEFGLHELAVEDAHRAHQRPKLETYGDCLFVVLHTAQVIDAKIHFGETHVFIGPRYVVSIRHGASLSYAAVRAKCETAPERLRHGPGYVLYQIMDFVVDNYFPIVEALEDELASVEDTMFKGLGRRKTSERLYELKRQLMALRRAVVPVGDICLMLQRPDHKVIPESARPYFRDIHDHVLRIHDAVDNMREMLNTALQVNLSLVSLGQGEVVKRLAGWGAILAVPTLVASIYGMNFEFMPELHWKFGYPVVLGGTVVGCMLLYRRLKRAGWL